MGDAEIISATQVSGWAYDPSTPAASIKIRLDVDNTPIATFPANVSRPVLTKYLGSAHHGFSHNFKLAPGPHRVAVYAIDTTSGSAVLLRSQVVQNAAPRAVITSITATSAKGWAFLPTFDNGVPSTRLDIDNNPGSVNVLNVTRIQGGPNYTFNIPLPKLLPGKHTARLYVLDYLTFNATLLDTITFTI